MSDTDGPKLRISADCFGCTHCRTERYAVQSDSGCDVYCDHPKSGGKHIGDNRWNTPAWCPLYHVQLERLLAKLKPVGPEQKGDSDEPG